MSIHLGGDINIPALEESLTELIRRHEILRTTYRFLTANFAPLPPQLGGGIELNSPNYGGFRGLSENSCNGQPCQEIQPPSAFTLPIVDLREWSETKRETEAVRIATEQLRQGFDFTRSPLLRATLIQLTSDNYRLYFAIHHSFIDGESFIKIVQELEIIYTAFSQGLPSPLPELTIQYADFAVWQRQRLQGEILSNQLTYWQKQLENLPQLKLPTDRPRTPQTTFSGSFLRHRLPFDLIEKLQTLSRKENVTLFVTLATAIKVLLYRYSNQEDIVLGTVIDQRDQPELDGIIGNFLNTLVLRSDLSGNPSFCELLKRVQNVCFSAYSHQDVPFQKVVEALHPDYQVNKNPLFQVAFTIDPPLVTEDKLGWKAFYFEVDPKTSKFDITFYLLQEESEGMVLLTEYNTDLFDAATIKRMSGHLNTLLEGIVINPNQSISELPLLTESERHQLLVEWNNTTVDYPQDKCIHQLFEEQVERTPDAVAVVFEDRQLTYHELNCQANQLAHYLQTLGVAPEVLVGICVERSVEMVVGLLGILKAGGAYVPLDPNYPTERIAYMLEDSSVPVLLTQSKWVEKLPSSVGKLILLDSDWDVIASLGQDNPVNQTKPDHLVYVIYTSGSTGKPKGVAVTHLGINRLVNNTNYINLASSDRVAQTSNASFDAATFEIWGALLHGAQLIGVPQQIALEAEKFVALLRKYQVSVLFLTTALFNQLAALVPEAFKSLRYLLFGAETVDPTSVKKVLEHGAPEKLLHVYGPAENTTFSSWYLVENVRQGATTIPIGRPISNTQVYILDKQLQPVPIGIQGELHIGGDGLARGYLNRRELTEEKFIPNPFDKSKLNNQKSKLYKTGDLARYLPDGNIEYLGRIDHQVKIRGFRIELGEIEAVLAQHSQVREAVVIAREDIPGDKRLVAYLTTNEEKTTIDDLRSFLKTKLPEYMIPAAFVLLESIPLTPNGKVNRRGLPIPDASSLVRESSFIAPRDSLELQLTQIWSEILGVFPIGVRDNFFDLGGYSLLAVRLMADIEKQFGKNLSLAALFQGATVEQLAILLRQKTDTQSWSPLVAIQPQGKHPPFFCMPGSGGNVVYFHQLARHLGNDQPFYALQPPSLDGISEPFGRVEEVAAYYLQAIQTLQPSGPYFLGGHSFGVLVAFEMAQQLQKQGETVALLALLDLPTRLPGSPPKQLDWDDTRWLTNIAHIIEVLSAKNLGIFYEALKPLTPEAQLNYLKQQMESVNLLPYNSGIERVRGIVQTIKADELAFMSYLPQGGYQGRITLFRTSEVYQDELGMLGEIPTDPTWGWNQYSCKPVEVKVVPGNHTTMLGEPHVMVLAEKLKFCLARVC
ncbi:MAG: amino acid adenylation domain-containing protein [Okeania sp. SIO2C9]|nr:amino acid adenylation domain-containing protein [Okeania sp. SIO2C9]